MPDQQRGQISPISETDDVFTGRLSILEALEKLRLRLLELTHRNRLLNFRHSPGKCIQFVDAQPNIVFHRLMENTDKRVLLLPVPEPHRREWINSAGRITRPEARDYAKKIGIDPSFELASGNNQFNNTSSLRALYYPEDLERYCRKLHREMKSGLEETGAHMLFLIFGFLEFPEKGPADRTMTAPLISVPVFIEKGDIDRETRHYRYYISNTGEELSENLSLREKLRQDHGFELPSFDEGETTPEDYFGEIHYAIKNKYGWRIRRQMTLALLSFTKMLLVRDIDPRIWPTLRNKESALADHPIVRMVFQGVRNTDGSSGRIFGEDYDIDDHPLNNLPLIYDADSSQHSALIDALSGRNMVIEGPPGTGKSQTITNLIAAVITEGKKVLFLSEKMAALEVVKKRLAMAGLDDFCLELHSNKTQKKRVLDAIQTCKTKIFPLPRALSAQLTALEEKRKALKAYADLLNSVVGNAQGLTVHQVIWRAERYRQGCGDQGRAVQGLNFSKAHELTDAEFQSLYDILIHVCRQYQHIGTSGPGNPFWGFFPTVLMPGDELKIEQILNENLPQFERFQKKYETMATFLGGEELKLDPQQTKALEEMLDSIRPNKYPKMSRTLLPVLFSPSDLTAKVAETALQQFDEKAKHLRKLRMETGERLRQPDSLDKADSDEAETLRKNLSVFGLTDLSCQDLETLAIDTIQGVADLRRALTAIEECGHIVGITFDYTEASLLKIRTLVDIAQTAPRELLRYRHPAFKNRDVGSIIERAGKALENIKCERTALSEIIYLDLVPSEDKLIQSILVLREGDAWYRIFQGCWRQACRMHRVLDKTKSRKSRAQRLWELERLLALQKAAASWHADQTYKYALGPLFQGEDTDFDKAMALVSWHASTHDALVAACLDERDFNALDVSEARIAEMAHCYDRLESAYSTLVEARNFLGHRFPVSQELNKKIRETTNWSLLEDLLCWLGSLIKNAAEKLLTWSPENILVSHSLQAVISRVWLPHAIAEVDKDIKIKKLLGKEFRSIDTDTESAWTALSYGRAVLKCNLPPAITRSLLSDRVDANFEEISSYLKTLQTEWEIIARFSQNMSEYGHFDLKLWSGKELDDEHFPAALVARTICAAEGMDKLLPWVQYLQQSARARERGLEAVVSLLESGKVGPETLPNMFGYRFYFSIISRLFHSYPALEQFAGTTHETIRAEFAKLDHDIIKLRGIECAHKAAHNCTPPQGTGGARVDDKTELSLLNYLLPQTRPRMSIRKMMSRAGRAIQAFKPCFMMGPQAVAQFIEPAAVKFDIVVMDEASQLKPEEAIGAIARGKQLIVVGDPKQLPPTTFFDRLSITSDDSEDEGQQAAALISQSILDVCIGHFQPVRTLRWHYRSKHESLIAFSNHNFYKNLIIFPSPYPKGKFLGVHYHYIANGIYQEQMNVVEAKHVSDAVIDHMLNHPDESLGVVTLNLKQRDLIEELLEQRYRSLQKTDDYRSRWEREGMGFFVKNLENVQGDERDIIFISATFGKPPGATVVRQNFGPISRADGWRRLNVLFTRARKAVQVFSSMRPEDIVVDANTPLGTKTLRDYLEYARSGNLVDITPTGGEAESDFEIAVANVLRNHGFEVEPQLGVAGFRIDIAVKHPNYVSAYLAAIECDGATYHSGVSVRDRDRIRQEILESLGWKNRIWRIWSTDWFRNPGRETAKLIGFLNEIKNMPLDGAYFVKPKEIVVPTAIRAAEMTQLTLQGLGVSVIKTEDDEREIEVGDTVFYINAANPEHEIKILISPNQHDPSAGIISKGHTLAQAMLGVLVNDHVTLKDSHGSRNFIIKKIVKARSAENVS